MLLELTLVLQDKKSCMSFSSDEETELGRSWRSTSSTSLIPHKLTPDIESSYSKNFEKKLCLKCRTSSILKQDLQQECWLRVEVDDPQSSLPKWKEGRILQLQGLTIDPFFATTSGCTSLLASSQRGCSIGDDVTASDFSPALILPRASPRQMLWQPEKNPARVGIFRRDQEEEEEGPWPNAKFLQTDNQPDTCNQQQHICKRLNQPGSNIRSSPHTSWGLQLL